MILDDLSDYLSSQGIGTIGTDLFKASLPSTPDAAVALFKYGGPAPVHMMSAGPGTAIVERPHLQVLARHTHPANAEKKAQDIWTLLDALGDKTINGVRYLSVYAIQTPFFFQKDETGRFTYACNYEIVREPATSS